MVSEPLPAPGFGTSFDTDETHERFPQIGNWTEEPEDIPTAAVASALNVGYRHIDTAEMYDTEAAVGRALERVDVDRDDVFVATKVHPDNLAYEDVLDHARDSRERLGVDTLDLLYVHWPIRTYEAEETLAAFDELYDRGEIRHVGLSNFTPELLEEALSLLDAPVFAHQIECHPLLQQEQLRQYANEYGHHLVAYSPLAQGAVTEVPDLEEIAQRYDTTAPQVALAWLLSKDIVPVPRSTSATHIRANYEAKQLRLDTDALERIDGLSRTERTVDFPDAPWN